MCFQLIWKGGERKMGKTMTEAEKIERRERMIERKAARAEISARRQAEKEA